ncbi:MULTISPECIES: hypothetical protein [Pseudomonas]|uniref:hypothetical protein n=1 Tax=Pseudomonas TaxID=286 RepID=UPI002362E386|nr:MULTISPECIES: hypothetical protein [Pseudomonas]WJV24004.1 hypothetical protein PSR66_31025 [Pseudomonas chlororaphis]
MIFQAAPISSRLKDIYRAITNIYPDKPWLDAVDKIQEMRSAFPMRVGQAEVDNWIIFSLTKFERGLYKVDSTYEWKALAEAMLHVERVARHCESVQNGLKGPRELEQRFRGSMKNPDDGRAIRFELYMAELLALRGCKIEWPQESAGEETFDLLVQPTNGLPEFELECKSFGGAKGASVEISDGQRLLEACMNLTKIHELIPSHPKLASILTVDVSGAIPKDEKSLKLMAGEIISCIKGGNPTKVPPAFRIRKDVRPLIGNPDDPDSCHAAANQLPGSMLGFVATGSHEEGWKGFQVSWSGKFTLWRKAEKTGKDALDRQLTKKRPGAVALQFVNDTAASIWLSNNEESEFRRLADKLFTREHAALVVVTTEINARPVPELFRSPFRSEGFMAEFCRFAAFDNQNGSYPNTRLKYLFM